MEVYGFLVTKTNIKVVNFAADGDSRLLKSMVINLDLVEKKTVRNGGKCNLKSMFINSTYTRNTSFIHENQYYPSLFMCARHSTHWY